MFQEIFDAFSKRTDTATKKRHEVPPTRRTRVLMWVNELYRGTSGDLGLISYADYCPEFWQEIGRRIVYRTGDTQVTQTLGLQKWAGGGHAVRLHLSRRTVLRLS